MLANKKISRLVVLFVILATLCISLSIPALAAPLPSNNVAYTSSFGASGSSEIQQVTLTKRMTGYTCRAVGGGTVTLFVLNQNNSYVDSIYFDADGVSRTFGGISYPAGVYHMYFQRVGGASQAAVSFN